MWETETEGMKILVLFYLVSEKKVLLKITYQKRNMEMKPCSTSAETKWPRIDLGMEKDHLRSKETGGRQMRK